MNPDTGAIETFVGDPNLTEAVTGSPFNTNFVRIQGPAGTIQTNLFTVSGKVLDSRAQTPVDIGRATYRRTSSGPAPQHPGRSLRQSGQQFEPVLPRNRGAGARPTANALPDQPDSATTPACSSASA